MPKYFYSYHLFYKKFFKEHLLNNFKQCLEDKLHRLEARYHPNLITDENFNVIPIEEELSIIQDSLNEFRKIDKDFSFGITIVDEYLIRDLNTLIENLSEFYIYNNIPFEDEIKQYVYNIINDSLMKTFDGIKFDYLITYNNFKDIHHDLFKISLIST